MNYNRTYDGESFEHYLAYLKTIQNQLPSDLYDFITDADRYNFSQKSLHDSTIKNIVCNFNLEDCTTNITLTLFGEDREFILEFEGISQYQIAQKNSDMYRDLITYEVCIEQDSWDVDKIVFRAAFACDEGLFEVFANHISILESIV